MNTIEEFFKNIILFNEVNLSYYHIDYISNVFKPEVFNYKKKKKKKKQEGHDGPVSLHWLIREIHSYQTLHYLGIGLKHKTPYKD